MSWRAYLTLGRPSNLPTVWTNVLAGSLLADFYRAQELRLVLLMLAVSALYAGGMFLNDAFDREWDARERPERPIPKGEVRAGEAFAIGFGLLGAGVAGVAIYGTLVSTFCALGLAVAILIYDAWHKKNPLAPLIMGSCRALVYLTAGATVTGAIDQAVLIPALVLLAYVVGLTYVARQETLASFRGFWPLVLLAAPVIYGIYGIIEARGGTAGLLFVALYAVWTARAISWLTKKQIPRAVVSLIAGISLVDAIAVSTTGRTGIAIACALGCFATLRLQRWVSGT